MGTLLSRYALSMGAAAALLAACGGSQPPVAVPNAMPQSRAVAARANNKSYKVVYSFSALPDGNYPAAGLIDVKGTFYGTTEWGGTHGGGTVFSVTSGGTEKVLHSFGKGADGDYPNAALIDVGGKLYGTTEYGGSGSCSSFYTGCGTVFRITTSGTEKVLYKFGDAKADGTNPDAGLIDVGGKLYGTTSSGGAHGVGTAFRITMGGAERVLHSFGHGTDGSYPDGTLIDVGGTLYGTTGAGGAYGDSAYEGEGTVFSITTGGTEKVLHSFGHGTDGAHPVASLIDVKGKLYGTTFQGGYLGAGAVFSSTLNGKEKVLYSFGEEGSTDGTGPLAGLIDGGGMLYGTTVYGGAYGTGTIFSVTTSGAERVLHSFGSSSDGAEPGAPLIAVKGTFYGTTYNGGSHNVGTVFALTP